MKPIEKNVIVYTTSYGKINDFRNGYQIDIDRKEISLEFIKEIFKDNDLYNSLLILFQNDYDELVIKYVLGKEIYQYKSYNKKEIILAFEEFIKTRQLKLSPEETIKYEKLKELTTFTSFLEKYANNLFEFEVDGKEYQVPTIKLISLMQLQYEDYKELLNDQNIKTIDNIPKEYIIYLAYKYFKEHNLLDKYFMPEKIIKRFYDLKNDIRIDLHAINKCFVTEDDYYKKTEITKELADEIVKNIPSNATDLEKAIYVYIKMCKLFVYEAKYYLDVQKGIPNQHSNIENISTITKENNKIVCFEFNVIYAQLLERIGLTFKSKYKSPDGYSYGMGHAYLEFRCGKYLVKADAVATMFNSDFIHAKLNQPLEGLTLLNRSTDTLKEFNSALEKMYHLIIKQESNKEQEIILPEKLIDKFSNLLLQDRFGLLIKLTNDLHFEEIEHYGYLQQLYPLIFKSYECKNNIKLSIIRNNNDNNPKIATIITYNEEGYDEDPYNTKYYYHDRETTYEISKKDLVESFQTEYFEYLNKDSIPIPGIIAKRNTRK